MYDILNANSASSNQWLNIVFLFCAGFRIYLELINYDFSKLPLTHAMFIDKDKALRFHRTGFYLSLGYIILSAPFTLFASS